MKSVELVGPYTDEVLFENALRRALLAAIENGHTPDQIQYQMAAKPYSLNHSALVIFR